MISTIEGLLGQIKEAIACFETSGDVLPLPPSSVPDKSTLVVNCFFKSSSLPSDNSDLVAFCQVKTKLALAVIREFSQVTNIEFEVVGISLFQIDTQSKNLRIYWVNSRKESLCSVSADEIDTTVTARGSHLEAVALLLGEKESRSELG